LIGVFKPEIKENIDLRMDEPIYPALIASLPFGQRLDRAAAYGILGAWPNSIESDQALGFAWSMIFSGSRFPPFGIML
jgi:hypothetical protein